MTDRKSLQKEQEKDEALEQSFSSNPAKAVIQKLFKEDLAGAKYRKFSISDLKLLVTSKLQESNSKPNLHSASILNLSSKIKKAKDSESILMILNEYLFS